MRKDPSRRVIRVGVRISCFTRIGLPATHQRVGSIHVIFEDEIKVRADTTTYVK